jgi:hypothetical protein
VTAARPETSRAGVLPAAALAELATIGAGHGAYALVRLAIRAGGQSAFAHAAGATIRRYAGRGAAASTH